MNTSHVSDLIDRRRLVRAQIIVRARSTISRGIEGFEMQAIGKQCGIANSDLDHVFGAGLFGMAIGGLAERAGGRPLRAPRVAYRCDAVPGHQRGSDVAGAVGSRTARVAPGRRPEHGRDRPERGCAGRRFHAGARGRG